MADCVLSDEDKKCSFLLGCRMQNGVQSDHTQKDHRKHSDGQFAKLNNNNKTRKGKVG